MDGDPAVEPELDSFSLTFPLPYRVAFIVVFAVWAWGVNLHYLHLLKIDVPSLIRYPGRSSPHQPPHHFSTYRVATVLSLIYGLSLVLFWMFTHHNPGLVIAWDWLPLSYLIVLIVLLFLAPIQNFATSGRGRLLSTLKRISIGGIAEAKDGKFGDILLADVLTSYAKVMGDLYVVLCMFFRHNGSATARPNRNCGGLIIVPFIMAWPSLMRLRQCLIEYYRVARAPKTQSTGWGGQHLANALKYSTAFPVIILSALLRNFGPSTTLYRAWVFACLVNSLYSFYWDVTKDWDLTLFCSQRERNSSDHPYGLRRRYFIGSPSLYYCVIALDLLLRCTWSLKLSPHLDHLADFESSIFVIEFLEVFRRWIWIFFRVETEWIRNLSSGLDHTDILLGDYYKDEDDE